MAPTARGRRPPWWPAIPAIVLPIDRRIAIERRGPEAMRQHRDASRVRTVISAIEEPSADGAKPHHFEVRAADHAGANDAWFAESQQVEFDGREIAERADRLRARLEVVDLRNRKGDVLCAETWRVLADVDQTIFVAIDQRPQQHAADHAEDRGVGADAERERDHDRGGQALGPLQRAAGDPDVLCESRARRRASGCTRPGASTRESPGRSRAPAVRPAARLPDPRRARSAP